MCRNLPHHRARNSHSRHPRLRPHGRSRPLVRTTKNAIRDLWRASQRRPPNRNPNRNKASFKKAPKAMKKNAERISNRNTDRHFGAATAASNHRTPGETRDSRWPRNNPAAPGFVVGALEALGYTSSPVLGMCSLCGLWPRADERGPGFYIHRTQLLALLFARSYGAYCTTTRWRSNHATQKIHPCLKRARSPHRARLRPQYHVLHHVNATRMLRWWAGPLRGC